VTRTSKNDTVVGERRTRMTEGVRYHYGGLHQPLAPPLGGSPSSSSRIAKESDVTGCASTFHSLDVCTLTTGISNMATSSNPYSAARPKRAGDHFTRTHHLGNDEPSAKKPRFDPRNPSTLAPDNDDEEDPALEADVIGKGAGVKRNAVNIDGYESDSSTENFDARADARKNKDAPPKDEDDDDDMFAEDDKDDEQDEDTRRGDKKKKKQLRFLDDAEIEGQEGTSKSGGHVAADLLLNGKGRQTDDVESSSDSGDDEERDRIDSDVDEEIGAGGKKKHAPKLDAFNMRAEQEEGRFDEAGNFVRKAFDAEAAQDSWMDGLSKKDIKKAKEAHDKREEERRQREREEDSIVTSDVLSALIANLEVGESPMEALVRHGKAVPKKKTSNNWSKKKKAQEMDVEPDPSEEAAAAKAKEAIDAITESASRLTDRGVENIYELPREMIMRQYKRETGEDWKNPNPSAVRWEFHWLTAPEGDINGPYDKATMQAWEQSGQFEAGAEFRKVGENEWSRLLDLDD
jgi:CD2 antigen cytoplasmic tail-binding protein 2